MPLPLPDLDTRAWADLVDEARTLIPRYAPGWTDHNVHDPGITLVELLAWLVELDVYQLNRIPDAHRRKFLALVGQSPRAAAPARTWLSVTPPGPVDVPAGTMFVATAPDGTQVAFRASASTHCEPIAVRTSGTTLDASIPLMLTFDAPLPVGQRIRFAFGFAGGRSGADERARIAGEPGLSVSAHHSVALAWEVSLPGDAWLALDPGQDQVGDDTRALTLDGTLEVSVPTSMGTNATTGYTLRARVVSGAYDTPVQLNATVVNAIPVAQVTPVQAQPVGFGTGLPSQQVPLPLGAVVGGSLHVTTDEGGTQVDWQQRPDLDASAPADRHVVLDRATPRLIFGDGNHGRIPPRDAQIQATYFATLGRAGNQPAGAQFSLAPSVSLPGPLGSLASPLPAVGGDDDETLDHAAGRAVADIQAPTRAVTAADYETLALRTPGTAVARTRALPGHYAPLPGLAAPGVVTVIVVPAQAVHQPTPSAGLLRSVKTYLGRRRVLGTHVDVVGPTYVEVQVVAGIRARLGADLVSVQANVLAALVRFFDPLRGGSDGRGWPFGRAVYRAEVLQVIDAVTGVDSVLSLEMSADGQPAQCGNLCIGATQLVASGQHRLEVTSA
jgi:hypothetical protein